MATAVEGLFSSLGASSSSTNSTRPSSIEVIDVDLLSDDDEVQVIESRSSQPVASSSRRPESSTANRIPEPILLIDDSDDETLPSTTGRRGRRRIFSPPPPRQNPPFVMIPPVPRVPPQFSGQTSSIGRPGRRTGPPAPVHAVERSFDFDFGRSRPNSPAAGPSSQQQASSSSSRAANQSNAPGTRVAPPPHHVPTIGLGGALIARNRARMVAERTGRAPGSGGFFTVLTDGLRRAYRSSGFSIVPGTEPEPEEPFEEGIQDYLDSLRGRDRYRQPLKEKEQYKPFYTHPAPAEPGFTHDFAPDASSESAPSFPPSSKSAPIVIVDEEDESKPEEETKMSTTLVCARCYDPLVLNAGLTGSEASQRRIWALRCGHLLDGKCVSQIGQPALTVDRKGKGKAKEEIPYGEAPSSRNQREIATDTEEPPAGTTSIRSRLRSRAQSGTQDANSDLLPPSPNSRKRKRGPTKASANKKAKVEDVFEWQCPVPGCGKMHASVKINGGWGPEKERQMKKGSQATVSLADLEMSPRGIIPVFV